jgi:hypothetical protein
MNLTITMTDSFGDGWNGNILGIRQNGIIVGTFGQNFRTGRTTTPAIITINSTIETQIVVVQKGNFTHEIGFAVRATSNGTTYFSHVSGRSFAGNFLFKTFCPTTGCQTSPTVDYFVTLHDNWGDSWNGNILAFRQGTTLQTFTLLAVGPRTFGPIKYTFNKGVRIDIVVNVLGTWTE